MISKEKTPLPLIFEIKGNALEDGPGIRSVIFLKGCNLDCSWCHNPESKKIGNELLWDNQDCIACGACMKVCSAAAISPDFPFFVNRDRCTLCLQCVQVCPPHALRLAGKTMKVEEIIENVLCYKPYFDTSGGGVTLSGGEPTIHLDFSSALLSRLQAEGIHTLLQTAGLFEFDKFEAQILPFVNTIYFDLKLIAPDQHQAFCGVSNQHILKNFLHLFKESKHGAFELLPRTPLIPGITDSEKNISALVTFYKQHGVRRAVLLPSNPAWLDKLNQLGQPSAFQTDGPLSQLYASEKTAELKTYFSRNGIEVSFG